MQTARVREWEHTRVGGLWLKCKRVMWNLNLLSRRNNRSWYSWQLTYRQSVLRAAAQPARNVPFLLLYKPSLPHSVIQFIFYHTETQNPREVQAISWILTLMASTRVMLLAAMSVFVAVISVASAAEAPAPSPTSPASAASPSFIAGFVAAVAALAFGSALRIWAYRILPRNGFSLLLVWIFSRGRDFTSSIVYKTLYISLSFFLLQSTDVYIWIWI